MITHVAIKQSDGKIFSMPKPYRHGDILKKMENKEKLIFGFMNENNIFLDRKTAWHEAFRCGQILPPYNPINPPCRAWELKPNDEPCDLFSEDFFIRTKR